MIDRALPTSAAVELRAAAERLESRVGHWSPGRWRVTTPSGASRAELIYELVCVLADLAAWAEGRAPRLVPRLDNNLALHDQLRVMIADLLLSGAGEAALQQAADSVIAASRAL